MLGAKGEDGRGGGGSGVFYVYQVQGQALIIGNKGVVR